VNVNSPTRDGADHIARILREALEAAGYSGDIVRVING
jgi:hypothetical protein